MLWRYIIYFDGTIHQVVMHLIEINRRIGGLH